MFARLFIFFIAAVLLWTGLPVQEQWVSSGLVNIDHADARESADQARHAQNGSLDDHHLDEQPAQPHAEGATDLPESLPARHAQHGLTLPLGWAGAFTMSARLPPYLDGPHRPPNTLRIFA